MMDKVDKIIVEKINELGKQLEDYKKAIGDKPLGFSDKSLEKEARRIYKKYKLPTIPDEGGTRLYVYYEKLCHEIGNSKNMENTLINTLTSIILTFAKDIPLIEALLKRVGYTCSDRIRNKDRNGGDL